ncbi:signal peptidase II [Nanoarchaeota archaeon]
MRKETLFLFAIIVVILDQISKYLILSKIGINNKLVIFNWLHLTVTMNEGIVFGMFKGANLIFIFITLILLGFILLFYEKIPKGNSLIISFGLILGGGLGNLIDRLIHGAVIDFINFQIWPIFNLADAAITIGVILAIIKLWKE